MLFKKKSKNQKYLQTKYNNLKEAIYQSRLDLSKCNNIVFTENWQSKKSPFKFIEIQNLNFIAKLSNTRKEAKEMCNPFDPWADEHFEERVGGLPLNPPPSHERWLKGNEKYMSGDKFSHSYPERMWSKGLHTGIRYEIGDLSDAVTLLKKDPTTRQCFIPIWFPEDLSAAVQGERVPCTFGWHLMIRDNKLHCHYPMRSCDAVRHFHNDLYLANLLVLWMIKQLKIKNLEAGDIMFSCSSFHCFDNDRYTLNNILSE